MLTVSFTKFRVRTQNVNADNWVLGTSSLTEEDHTPAKWGHIGHMMSPTSNNVLPFPKAQAFCMAGRKEQGRKRPLRKEKTLTQPGASQTLTLGFLNHNESRYLLKPSKSVLRTQRVSLHISKAHLKWSWLRLMRPTISPRFKVVIKRTEPGSQTHVNARTSWEARDAGRAQDADEVSAPSLSFSKGSGW